MQCFKESGSETDQQRIKKIVLFTDWSLTGLDLRGQTLEHFKTF